MTVFQVIGWTGNALFFSRFLVQWLASERAGRSVAPAIFWWISLLGAAFMSTYTAHLGEPVLMIGILVNGALYARNLLIERKARRGGRGSFSPLLTVVAVALGVALFVAGVVRARETGTATGLWLACVLVGQGLWSSRFVIQWWYSERHEESHFPLLFWWVSLGGNSLLLAYSIHLLDPVLVAGFSLGPIVQTRNIILSLRARTDPPPASSAGADPSAGQG